jgi:hypothetical protein
MMRKCEAQVYVLRSANKTETVTSRSSGDKGVSFVMEIKPHEHSNAFNWLAILGA